MQTPHVPSVGNTDADTANAMNSSVDSTSDRQLVLRKFLRHGTMIASVTPSSRAMARAMTKDIDLASARCIVELGAGTGPVTEELLRRSAGNAQIVIVERDPDFCRRLRRRFPGEDIVEADALDLEAVLRERGILRVDAIVSGLGLPSFPPKSRDRMLRIIGSILGPSGTLHQLTEVPLVYRGLYRQYFEDVRFHLVLRNIPPGGVYVCSRPRLLVTSPETSARTN